jgi:hypothetical protein
MAAPQYCRTRDGRVYRILRSSHAVLDPERVRYTLRAVPIRASLAEHEASTEVLAELLRDRIRHRLVIPTPESTFEQLWQQLRLDIDAQVP